ncbi:MAG: polysaccharide deacetylase family protein [Lamprobacter sp.]|uniref:polysaccharide deacetylase family protein n=1 Tax=Lamprobacter sp. TaxID=3100796 RepID=UPI002B259190|nr:polysaccharide deacetylase family protein [Lamprobacter sp.]MEA3642872.1 polysaccharide deacetylase family protein [Lamprobacter sp.]
MRSVALPLIRPVVSLLSPGGHRGRLSILIYHRVLAKPDPMLSGTLDAQGFRWQMQTVKQMFNVIGLADAVKGLAQHSLPPRAACITFDDGYRDNLEVAVPILQELDMSATFFVATGYLDGGIMFNDRVLESLRRMPEGELDLEELALGRETIRHDQDRQRIAEEIIIKIKHLEPARRDEVTQVIAERSQSPLPKDLMMTSEQVKRLSAAGMTIGGHTQTHPILSRISDQQAQDEIAGGREDLEALLRQPVRLFAYPNGKPGQDYNKRHVAMVRAAGFDAAVSTAWGVSTARSDPYQLARFTPWDQTPTGFAARLSQNLMTRKAAHAL